MKTVTRSQNSQLSGKIGETWRIRNHRLHRLPLRYLKIIRLRKRIFRPATESPKPHSDIAVRQAAVDFFVEKYLRKFSFPSGTANFNPSQTPPKCCVLIAGATGSLGAHLAEQLANVESVATAICFNGPSSIDPIARPHQVLEGRVIQLDNKASTKLQVLSSHSSKPLLGLDGNAYTRLVERVTLIVHNA